MNFDKITRGVIYLIILGHEVCEKIADGYRFVWKCVDELLDDLYP